MLSVDHLPSTNGVYTFLQKGTPIYIGKSVNIKARVKSHLENAKQDPKEAAIISQSDDLTYIITDSELNALLLESKLIQTHKPKYNVRWRDDKSYLYIKITTKETYPKITVTRKESDPKAVYFGPFASMRVATGILREIRKVFPFCTQKNITKQGCFYSKIKLCDPCPNVIERTADLLDKESLVKQYKLNIRNVQNVLEGKTDVVIKKLYKTIQDLTQENRYEQAIGYRDRLRRLEGMSIQRSYGHDALEEYNVSEKRKQGLMNLLSPYMNLNKLDRIECYDMSTLLFEYSTASLVVFTDGLSDKKEYRRFRIKNPQANSDFDMFKEVIARRLKRSWPLPDLLIVDGGKPQLQAVVPLIREVYPNLPIIGMAKRPDRIVLGDTLMTIRPPRNHPGFRLVQQMRDESHRFAKSYHLHLRKKNMV